MNTKHFDLAIIGGGATAFAAAIRADELGANTVMINAGLPLGGTCVNVGCVPSKALLRIAEFLHNAKNNHVPGVSVNVEAVDFGEAIEHELSLVLQMRQEKYKDVLGNLKHVIKIDGRARFETEKTVIVNGDSLYSDKFLIATGSTTTVPDILGLRKTGYLTHIEALSRKKLPESLAIIGAGPVGLEFAQIFSRFGTNVTVLVRSDRIMRTAEVELSKLLMDSFISERITILTNTNILEVRNQAGMKTLRLETSGTPTEIKVEEILLASGKTPNTAELNLEKAGVRVNERQEIEVTSYLQTSTPSIFAAGDVVNLPLRLEPTAGKEGTNAANNMISNWQISTDYDSVPFTVFTDPELAGVGWTEDRMMRELASCLCRTVTMANVPRAIITGRTEGAIKIVAEPITRRIRGIHILAPHAGELVAQAMTVVKNGNTIDDLADSLPMFPTYAESLKIAAMSFDRDISKLSCCV